MHFNVTDRYHAAVIEIQGKFLGSLHGEDFRDILDDLKANNRTRVVVDLSQTAFMDSSAIGALISGLTTMRRAGGDMRLAGMDKRVKNVFLMTRLLGPVFEDYPSVEEAATSYEQNPPPAPAA